MEVSVASPEWLVVPPPSEVTCLQEWVHHLVGRPHAGKITCTAPSLRVDVDVDVGVDVNVKKRCRCRCRCRCRWGVVEKPHANLDLSVHVRKRCLGENTKCTQYLCLEPVTTQCEIDASDPLLRQTDDVLDVRVDLVWIIHDIRQEEQTSHWLAGETRSLDDTIDTGEVEVLCHLASNSVILSAGE